MYINKLIGFIKEILDCFIVGLKFIFSLLKTKVAFVIYAMFFVYMSVELSSLKLSEIKTVNQVGRLINEQELKDITYNMCMQSPQYRDIEIMSKEIELNQYFNNKHPNTSIVYYNLKTGYQYNYNKEQVYFGASLIKTLSALYIYEQALIDESILDEKIIYTENYLKHGSSIMSTKSFGDQFSIRELVKYSINVSDNIAYKMLLEYIGFDKLKSFGHSIGNKYTLEGNDRINGKINPSDALNYMIRLNDYINNNGELGKELESYFNNKNAFHLTNYNSTILHKSGDWKEAHHNIAIVKDDNPFIIIVLTNNGQGELFSIKDISKKIYNYNEFYNTKRLELCRQYAD